MSFEKQLSIDFDSNPFIDYSEKYSDDNPYGLEYPELTPEHHINAKRSLYESILSNHVYDENDLSAERYFKTISYFEAKSIEEGLNKSEQYKYLSLLKYPKDEDKQELYKQYLWLVNENQEFKREKDREEFIMLASEDNSIYYHLKRMEEEGKLVNLGIDLFEDIKTELTGDLPY